MSDPDLSAALALTGPDATLRLYRAWAATYDTGFAAGMDYLLPAHVARAFVSAGGRGPVLDVGAGTGLLAERLCEMGFAGDIDALDLSAEMLTRAQEKRLYRRLIQADVTRPLPDDAAYNGIVSSGTFTAGHVGPEALPPLLAAAAPGAIFALSINRRVWAAAGFDLALADLAARGLIRDLQDIDVAVYGPKAGALDPEHAGDHAAIVLYAKV